MIYADMNWFDKTIRPLVWTVPAAGAWVAMLSALGLPIVLNVALGLAVIAFALTKVHQDPRNYRVVMGVALWAWAAFALGMLLVSFTGIILIALGGAVALLTFGARSVLARHRRANAGQDQGWGTLSTASKNTAAVAAQEAPHAASMTQHIRHAQHDLSREQMANRRREQEREGRLQAEFDKQRLEDERDELRAKVAAQDARLRVLQNELDARDDPFYDPPAPQKRA